jgi:methenyltetrahydromethanopterin cyclohydrolase
LKKALSNTKSFSVNSQAWKLLEELLRNAEGYGVSFEESKSGALIVDAGVNAEGGFEAWVDAEEQS